MLIVCGKSIITPSDLQTIFRTIHSSISEETEPGFLSSLYKSLVDTMLIIPPASIPANLVADLLTATQSKLQGIAQVRKQRSEHVYSQSTEDSEELRDDMLLIEELEGFALDEIGRFLKFVDPNHILLIAVGSVRELGLTTPM